MSFRDSAKIEELIELYEEEDLLWNSSHQHYYRRDKRKEAVDRIGAVMDIKSDEIIRKIINLRTYYGKEMNKGKQKKAKGEKWESRWEHYKAMDRFLYPFIQTRNRSGGPDELHCSENSDADAADQADCPEDEVTTINIKEEDNAEEDEEVEEEEVEVIKPKRRRRPPSDDDEAWEPSRRRDRSPRTRTSHRSRSREVAPKPKMTAPNPPHPPPVSATTTEDSEDLFGRIVAHELRQIADKQKRQLAKIKIQNLLFEVQFGCESLPTNSSNCSLSSSH